MGRKQINFILKLKPWRGTVAAVTILNLQKYQSTWNRIIEIQRALREQHQMLQHDFIPIFRAIDTLKITDSAREKMQNILNGDDKKQSIDIPNDKKHETSNEEIKGKQERVKGEDDQKETECKMAKKKKIDLKPKVISMESKLSAKTPAF